MDNWTWIHDDEFSFLYLDLNTIPTNSAPGQFGHIGQIERVGIAKIVYRNVNSLFKWPFPWRCHCGCLKSLLSSRRWLELRTENHQRGNVISRAYMSMCTYCLAYLYCLDTTLFSAFNLICYLWLEQVCVMIHSGSRGLGHQVATG